jgi:hypothetical protein
MKPLHIWVGALLVACGLVSGARAQGVAQPGRPASPKLTPSIDLMVTEPFSQVQTETFKREDIREVPPATRDKRSDSVRVTVTVGDPRCVPGEDVLEGVPQPRSRTFRPRR